MFQIGGGSGLKRIVYWQISVYPYTPEPENPNSYKARKREYFRMQRERKKARKEGIIPEPQLVLASAVDATDGKPSCWFLQVVSIPKSVDVQRKQTMKIGLLH